MFVTTITENYCQSRSSLVRTECTRIKGRSRNWPSPGCATGQNSDDWAKMCSNKNLAIANRSRVSCTHNTSRAFIGLITPWPWNLG